jgi:hypothetical protein
MKRRRLAVVLTALASVAAIATVAIAKPGAGSSEAGFDTAKPAYLEPVAPGVVIDPILSVSDTIGEYQMTGIPDGLGAYGGDDNEGWPGRSDDDDDKAGVTVVMNHELGRSFPNRPPGVDTRISRLEIDPKTHKVHDAEYLFEGDEGFERFCSSTLSIIDGRPLYFTGEEAIPMLPSQPPGPAHDGSSIAMDPETGMWVETPHFGHFQHENVVPIELKKWVFLSSEDDFRFNPTYEPSYLYAYIADDFDRAIRGRDGDLHVWKADNPAKNDSAAVLKGESIPGHFIPITQEENSNSTELKAAATARNAFRFERLEDIALRPDITGRTYIADTGKAPLGTPPANTRRGRVYQFDIDPRDPTRATLKMIVNGDAPDFDDIVNPDNMDASSKVLVIQEDRESFFRTNPSRVLTYRFSTKALQTVAQVIKPGSAATYQWESSGVIDVSHLLGKDWWLVDVQAHDQLAAPQPGPTLAPNSSVGEDGQLLAIKIPNTANGDQRRHGGDDD